MHTRNLAVGLLPGGRRVIGALAAVVLLVPVPTMALTFTGSWQSAAQTSGRPTPTAATFTDSTNGSTDDLFVDMGSSRDRRRRRFRPSP